MKHARAKAIQSASAVTVDPVCGMEVDRSKAVARVEHKGQRFYFCNFHCAEVFRQEPERYLDRAKKPQLSIVGGTPSSRTTPAGDVYRVSDASRRSRNRARTLHKVRNGSGVSSTAIGNSH